VITDRDPGDEQPTANASPEPPSLENAMNVRAKMTCESKTPYGEGFAVTLRAVTADTDENKTWAKYTPSGSVTMQIDNPSAADAFEAGKTYFVDFTPAP
jgi:hypothetical protein